MKHNLVYHLYRYILRSITFHRNGEIINHLSPRIVLNEYSLINSTLAQKKYGIFVASEWVSCKANSSLDIKKLS